MAITDVTVGTVVQRDDGRFLLIEEQVSGRRVLTQPGGHIEPDEGAQVAAEREALEEAGCVVRVRHPLGAYRWLDVRRRRACLRIMFVADLIEQRRDADLDTGVLSVEWMTSDEILACRQRHRSPVVARAVDDFRRGRRADARLQKRVRPLALNLNEIFAHAAPL